MKLLLLLLGANALVDGFTELHGVKFRDVLGKRQDRASWRKVAGEDDVVLWHRDSEKLEFLGVPVSGISFVEGKRDAGVASMLIEGTDCAALSRALTTAWGKADGSQPGHAKWTGSNTFADLDQSSGCSLTGSSLRWDGTGKVWKK